jgi:5-methylcytosine-specific restriction endonuclease McrA
MSMEPLCRYCRHHGRITVANRMDHIIALSLGGSNDTSNLAPACAPCNDAKSVLEQRYVRRGYALPDVANDPELGEWIRIGLRRSG